MSVSVGIITAQMLQDAHLTDIGAQGKQSTPSGAVDVEICLNALSTPRGSKQQSAGASDPYDSAHQGEWVRHSGRRSVRAEKRMANCAATSTVARLEDAHTPVRLHLRCEDDNLHLYRPVIYLASMEANFRWTTTLLLTISIKDLNTLVQCCHLKR
jgi:hypothetical protein